MDLAAHFAEHGFVTVPAALDPERIGRMNRAIDRTWETARHEWAVLSGSYAVTASVLVKTSAFDDAIENPAVLGPLRSILGEEITFEELSIIVRKPTANLDEAKGWHRDLIRDFDRRFEIDAVSAIYYLTDVTGRDHCFSIIPGSHDRLAHLRPGEHAPEQERDLTGPAGTAILFHARCLHCGKLKPASRERRSLHLYFSRAGAPRTNEWTDIPARLYQKSDPALPPLLYSKWNRTDILDGTGRRPADLDPRMPRGRMIEEVQRRAKLASAAGQG